MFYWNEVKIISTIVVNSTSLYQITIMTIWLWIDYNISLISSKVLKLIDICFSLWTISNRTWRFFFNLIDVNDIILFKFFVHFTHIIQFLDIEVFQSYKVSHDNAIKKTVRNENVKFNRFFLMILQKIWFFVFIKKTFRNVWKRCDINFFNSNMMLNSMKIKIIENKIIVARFFFFDSIECLRRTFRDFDFFKRNIFVLKKHYVEHRNFNINFRQMIRFMKNTKSLLNILQLTIRDFENAQKNIAQKKSRNNLSSYKIKISDIIIVSQCKKQYSNQIKQKDLKTKRKIKKNKNC